MINILISFLSGSFSAIVVSLWAPWVKWDIEKRKNQYQGRKELIDSCKNYINKEIFDTIAFTQTPLYSNIRPELPPELVNNIESLSNSPVLKIEIQRSGRDSGANNYKTRLLDAITDIEKKWELI